MSNKTAIFVSVKQQVNDINSALTGLLSEIQSLRKTVDSLYAENHSLNRNVDRLLKENRELRKRLDASGCSFSSGDIGARSKPQQRRDCLTTKVRQSLFYTQNQKI